MRANRRSFLSLLGVGTVTAPLAAKAAVDDEITQLTNVGRAALSTSGIGLGTPSDPVQSDFDYQQRLIHAADYVKMFGVPEAIEIELRDQCKWIHALDPDIAAKRSWSMSVKILEQRNRNYERQVERMKKLGWLQRKRSAIRTILGFEWPF
jgi:hypothetical protein